MRRILQLSTISPKTLSVSHSTRGLNNQAQTPVDHDLQPPPIFHRHSSQPPIKMTTQGPSALPPTIVHSTKPISQSAAHDFLAAYLDRAANDPALQPNASISEHGPVSRTTAAAPNLILHNLKRVQAGLAGEILGRDLTVAKQNPGEEYLDVAAGAVSNNQGREDENAEVTEDLEMRDPEIETEAEAFALQEGNQAAVDKEERKRKKKERRQAEKKAKAKKGDESD